MGHAGEQTHGEQRPIQFVSTPGPSGATQSEANQHISGNATGRIEGRGPIEGQRVSPVETLASGGHASQESATSARAYVRDIEQQIDKFRDGTSNKSYTITHILRILERDSTLSAKEKDESFELFLAEIDSIPPRRIQHRDNDHGAKSPFRDQPKDPRDRLAEFIAVEDDENDRLSKRSNSDSESGDSVEGGSRRKRRLRESDMPWFKADSGKALARNPSCEKTCEIIRQLSVDYPTAKLYLRLAHNAPRGIPMSQWERIIKGEPIDLDHILSSLHHVTIDQERKGRVGDTEIVLGGLEAKRKVSTSAEWSMAWRRAARAIAFIFRHREQELSDYGDYIEREFAAKHESAHQRIILYDIAVRNEVAGGQSMLLTDTHAFSPLYSAIIMPDGIEYNHSTQRSTTGNRRSAGSSKGEICLRYNSSGGCRFVESACRYRHACKTCGKPGHSKIECGGGTH
ncbi:hypothetical protein NLJ89_g10986 [Agrocybe chaxingu]|uniref:CCHC-type domain-containing protein n=1 Tax=Agrocybe chaxingu TaxID=84603 RepID=A0A9W8JQ79_9AGAR|nr:hypothetical protein NLJ89_g10986 [Agrocybe chaxingu]